MYTNIEEIHADIGNGLEIIVYQVDYTARLGDGYTCCNLWRTFGVYERKEVAEFVSKSIENGSIQPVIGH